MGWEVVVILWILWIIFHCCANKRRDLSVPHRPVKWAIFTQVHKPPEFSKWLDWHHNLQPNKIWIVVENDPRLVVPSRSNTVVQYKNNLGGGSWGSQLDDRKSANFDYAASQLRKEGIDWMIIVDDDEFIHGKDIGRVLSKYPNEDSLVIQNYEAVFDKINEGDKCFSPSARFIDCKKGKCLGYANGKSWGRISNPLVRQLGAHHITGTSRCRGRKIPEEDMKMLHFESCNFNKWKGKFDQIGKEMDKQVNFKEYQGTQEGFLKKTFPYYYKSAMEIKDIKDPQQLREFYHKHKVKPWKYQSKQFKLN